MASVIRPPTTRSRSPSSSIASTATRAKPRQTPEMVYPTASYPCTTKRVDRQPAASATAATCRTSAAVGVTSTVISASRALTVRSTPRWSARAPTRPKPTAIPGRCERIISGDCGYDGVSPTRVTGLLSANTQRIPIHVKTASTWVPAASTCECRR